MSENELRDSLYQYFLDHPNTDPSEIEQLAQTVKKEVWKSLVEPYQPIKVELRTELQSEFKDQRKAYQRRILRDESTEDAEELDELEQFNNNY